MKRRKITIDKLPLDGPQDQPATSPPVDTHQQALTTLRQLQDELLTLAQRHQSELATLGERHQTELASLNERLSKAISAVQSTPAPPAPPVRPATPPPTITPPAERKELSLRKSPASTAQLAMARQPDATISPSPSPASTSTGKSSLPAPPIVEETKRRMLELRQAIEGLVSKLAVPTDGTTIDVDIARIVVDGSRDFIQSFLDLHKAQRELAIEIRTDLIATGHADDPADYWDAAGLAQYTSFCSSRYATGFLQPIAEKLADHPVRESLLTYLASIMDLETLPVVPGASRFDRDRHDVDTGDAKPGMTIERIVRPGFSNKLTDHVVQKATVITTSEQDTPPSTGPAQTGIFSTDGKATSGRTNLPPEPPEVTECRARVFQVKMVANNNLTRKKLLKRAKLDPAVIELMREYSQWVLQRFTTMHTLCEAAAQQRYQQMAETDPERAAKYAWDPEVIAQYVRFRNQTIIEGFLDRLEVKLKAMGLTDQLPLVDHCARELDLAKLDIKPREATYDERRHEISGNVEVNFQGELDRAVIKNIIRPGYTDLNSGTIARKALVEVILPKVTRVPEEEYGAAPDDERPIDLDI